MLLHAYGRSPPSYASIAGAGQGAGPGAAYAAAHAVQCHALRHRPRDRFPRPVRLSRGRKSEVHSLHCPAWPAGRQGSAHDGPHASTSPRGVAAPKHARSTAAAWTHTRQFPRAPLQCACTRRCTTQTRDRRSAVARPSAPATCSVAHRFTLLMAFPGADGRGRCRHRSLSPHVHLRQRPLPCSRRCVPLRAPPPFAHTPSPAGEHSGGLLTGRCGASALAVFKNHELDSFFRACAALRGPANASDPSSGCTSACRAAWATTSKCGRPSSAPALLPSCSPPLLPQARLPVALRQGAARLHRRQAARRPRPGPHGAARLRH